VSRISRGLAERGIAVLRFDFTGLGASDGEFANTNFSSNVADLAAAAEFLRRSLVAPQILIGHSLGGAAVLAAAARVPEARAVCTIGAPADPSHVRRLLSQSAEQIADHGEAEVAIGGRSFRIRRQFLEDLEEQNLSERIRSLDKALLVLHSPADTVVGIDNARRIFETARHPKSFVSLDGADHLLSSRADASYVATLVSAWAERYLPEQPAQDAEAPGEGVLVAETGFGTYANEVRAGRHRVHADEPPGHGGADTGPSPYDYLLAGLGACTSMTLRMYANRKGWPLERVAVRLRHAKIHAQDCAECETETGRVDRIERELEIDGPLDADQRRRLSEIADRCPVHRTLTSETVIVTRLIDGSEGA
jgi:putative redox protein